MCARVFLTVFSVSIIGCVAEGEMRLEQVWVCSGDSGAVSLWRWSWSCQTCARGLMFDVVGKYIDGYLRWIFVETKHCVSN